MARETAASPTFEELGLPEDIVEALAKAGIVEPTPIQELCIPAILQGKDVVGKAETGTGKTVGFGAPIALRVDTNRVAPQALVLAPTRELAQQVAGVLVELGAPRNLRVALLVGGVHAMSQVAALRGGAQVVVGTPGRVLDFLQGGILSLVWVEIVVLDEADRMLDMGFIDDVTAILERVPEERQTLLFSATMPPEVQALLHRYMKDPAIFSTASGLATVPEIRQFYVACEFPRKFRELERILKAFRDETVLVFSNTRRQAIDLDRMLWGHGYSAASLHGERDQDERFRVLQAFRSGDVRVLVATDVASRGLDIEDVGCVVNYEVPADPESYVHRIGRTGRAKKTGTAISLVARKERRAWETILRETKFTVSPWRPGGAKERRPGGGHEASARRAASGDSSMDEEKRENGEEPGGPRGPGRSGPSPGPSPAAEGRHEGRHEGSRRGGRRGRGRRRQRPGGEGRREPGGEARREGRQGRPGPEARPPREAPRRGAISPEVWERVSRARQERPQRKRLEEVDDDFVRTEYFSVDPSILERGRGGRRRRRGKRRPGPPGGGGPAPEGPGSGPGPEPGGGPAGGAEPSGGSD